MKEVAVCPYEYAQTKGTVITGTGRAGTSFLVALLSTLKMPTGFTAPQAQSYLSNPAHAGLERMQTCKCHDSRTHCLVFSTQVQIVKSPYLAMDKWFPIWLTPTIQPLSNVIVPIRDSKETSISRANMPMTRANKNNNISGGFWGGSRTVIEQQHFDEHILSTLIAELTRQNIPTVLLSYPRHVLDAEYCADQLYFLRARYGVSYGAFVEAHRALSNTSLVHSQ